MKSKNSVFTRRTWFRNIAAIGAGSAVTSLMSAQSPNRRPTKVAICLPYEDAEGATEAWASEERMIDWVHDIVPAERCTVSFAAVELRNFLMRSVEGYEFYFTSSVPSDQPAIIIGPTERLSSVFQLDVSDGRRDLSRRGAIGLLSLPGQRLVLTGPDRVACLHAVYRYLEELGWRWYSPLPRGEVAPPLKASLPLDGLDVVSEPDFERRGFWLLVNAPSLMLWMARNRLNFINVEYVPGWYLPQIKKLGFFLEVGGHMTPRILDPTRVLRTGRTMFESHPEWYAEVNGKREKKNANRYQFCVSNDQAARFVANGVVNDLIRDFPVADRYWLGVFDTWTGWCECSSCKALGNDADKYLHLASKVWDAIKEAKAAGKISQTVAISLAAYEGTPALEGPKGAIPKNLREGRHVSAIFFPINRCYQHAMEDGSCREMNRVYRDGLTTWGSSADQVPVDVCEYYQTSRWEDLPAIFEKTIARDFPYYHRQGVRGISFMHAPVEAWGPRTFDYFLFARMSWSGTTDVDSIRDECFERYFEQAGGILHECHEKLASAYSNIGAWRNWHANSILSLLSKWKEGRPETELFKWKHLQPTGGTGTVDVGISPAESVALLDSCQILIQHALDRHLPSPVGQRVSEYARLFRYADDSLRLMWSLAQIYEHERNGRSDLARLEWHDNTTHLADSLDAYYVPHSYDYPEEYEQLPTGTVGPQIKDGLTRTQLRPLVERLRTVYQP